MRQLLSIQSIPVFINSNLEIYIFTSYILKKNQIVFKPGKRYYKRKLTGRLSSIPILKLFMTEKEKTSIGRAFIEQSIQK